MKNKRNYIRHGKTSGPRSFEDGKENSHINLEIQLNITEKYFLAARQMCGRLAEALSVNHRAVSGDSSCEIDRLEPQLASDQAAA